jgi:hypothetical protein
MAVRRAREKAASGKRIPPPSQCNRYVDSWGADRVPDHRRQLNKITRGDSDSNGSGNDGDTTATQRHNNQPTKGSAKVGGGGGSDSDSEGSGNDGDDAAAVLARRQRWH